jgi:DNA-binding NtrC family response regulator
MGGIHKVGMSHARLTPQLVIDAVRAFRATGEIHDAFDREALEAFGEIEEVRAEVSRLLSPPVQQQRPSVSLPVGRPEVPFVPSKPLVVMPAELEDKVYERVSCTRILDARIFEKRRLAEFVANNAALPLHVRREIASIHADLASVDGAQEAFLSIYKFSRGEMEAWTPARPVPAPAHANGVGFEKPEVPPVAQTPIAVAVTEKQAVIAPVVEKPAAIEPIVVAEETAIAEPLPVVEAPVIKPSVPASVPARPAPFQAQRHTRESRPSRERPALDESPRKKSVIENADVLKHVQMIVEGDDEMEKAWTLSQMYAKGSMIMLYRGERGTGKELFPRAVHQLTKKGGPFVAQNCAAVSGGIIESELFGHEKGAFTDARVDREGIFGQVKDGGTILLDEVGDMPLEQQAKLLRVLENRTYRRVGGNVDHKISPETKIIAATNRNLEQLVVEKLFRADLYDRLRGCQIRIPALRDRHADHRAALLSHLLNKYSQLDCPVTLSPEAKAYVMELDYPGNVREMRDHVERSVIIAQAQAPKNTEKIAVSLEVVRMAEDAPIASILPMVRQESVVTENFLDGALVANVPEKPRRADAALEFTIPLAAIDDNMHDVVDAIEALLVGALLKRHGNVSRVARATGITRGSVRERLKVLRNLDSSLAPPAEDEIEEPDTGEAQ